jgi:transcription antitermination factor NusG
MTNMGWHILNVTPGYEQKIKNTLELQADSIAVKIIIPTKKKKGFYKSKMYYHLEKIFPGYIFLECREEDEFEIFSLAAEISGILNMHGIVGKYRIHQSIEDDEMVNVLELMDENKDNIKVNTGISYLENQKIKIIDGPFSNFVAIVEGVVTSQSGEKKLKVRTNLFNNDLISLVLSEFQVEKVEEA